MQNRRRPIRIIKASEIKQYFSMQKAIDAMETAYSCLSSGEGFVPARYVTALPGDGLIMLFKPAFVQKEKKAAIKILTQRQTGRFEGIPSIMGIVLVIDADTGEILSIMDGEYLTALRTGAASGIATRYFARKDAETLALFGCGAQGKTQMEAVACERNLKKVWIFEKDKSLAEKFIDDMHETMNVEMEYTETLQVLNRVDIICTVTNATRPLFRKEDIKKGVHINALGSFQPQMQELDPYIVKEARVWVDQVEPCLKESGDLIIPIREGIILENHIEGEIGDYILKKTEGRRSEDEITIFKSVGVAIQDFVVATQIYELAVRESFGQDIDLFE